MHKLVITISALVVLGFGTPDDVIASQLDEKHVARQKINVSGRQRMLSQRMSAQACVATTTSPGSKHAQAASTAADQFNAGLQGLIHGSADLGLVKETNPRILNALEVVTQRWGELEPSVRQLAYGDVNSATVQMMMANNLPVLTSSNDAVLAITKHYGQGVIDPASAQTVNVAGRQRMLSQKMMKEACFIAVGIAPEDNKKALAATISLFLKSLTDLEQGSADGTIMSPPNDGIAQQLQRVRVLAEPFVTALSVLEPESPNSVGRLSELADQSSAVLKAMNDAVLMYVN